MAALTRTFYVDFVGVVVVLGVGVVLWSEFVDFVGAGWVGVEGAFSAGCEGGKGKGEEGEKEGCGCELHFGLFGGSWEEEGEGLSGAYPRN